MESLEAWVSSWVARWGDKIVHFAYTYVRDQGRAQDIAQESFLKLYQWRVNHPHREIRIGWLFTVTRNLALDDLRRHRLEVSLDSWADEVGLPTDDLLLRITVQNTLGRLSVRDRQVLWLFYYADLPIAEIARDLAISPNGVRLRLLRARQRFSQRWQEDAGHV